MSRYYLHFAFAWIVGVGVGCTSAPVRYYTLTPSPEWNAPATATTLAIDVRIVHATQQLHRSELMIRSGPTEVMLLENEKWATPVDDEIKQALRLELQRRLSRTAGLLPDVTKLTLDIDVQHFDAEFGRYALLEASWRALLFSKAAPTAGAWTATCAFRAEERLNAGYAEIVAGYQREIAALADAIAAAVTRPADGIHAPCH
jgi:uncharacterized lipoprotein YmbA